MEITVLTETCFFDIDDMGLRGHDTIVSGLKQGSD